MSETSKLMISSLKKLYEIKEDKTLHFCLNALENEIDDLEEKLEILRGAKERALEIEDERKIVLRIVFGDCEKLPNEIAIYKGSFK